MRVFKLVLSLVTLFSSVSFGLDLDVNDLNSLKNATSLVAYGLMDYYTGLQYGKTIGMFASPSYWWQAGGAWGSILDYWFYMENDTYNDILTQALLYQTGDNHDYMPLNQTVTEGNDDQAFWGFAVMAAAERNYPNPPDDEPQWLYLAQAVFNTMSSRWDMDSCGGGLRWQIFTWNSGYDYKNSVSNAALFHLSARLARYTGNSSYTEWAEKIYDWMQDIQLLVDEEPTQYYVYDGASIEENCTDTVKYQWTYNQGLMLSGSAYLYNFTESETWHERTKNFLNSSGIFFNNSIMYEAACQGSGYCNNDQRSFKAYFSRFLGLTAQLVPETRDTVLALLQASAQGAADSCSGGTDGHTCGLNWFYGGWDGKYGLGEQMAALEVMQNLRCLDRPAPYTADDGGTSAGNPAAGTEQSPTNLAPLTIGKGDQAGAGIITAVIGITIIGSVVWLII
ncbi:putative mannan endo-1,6-alpha-mannosidase [Kluyveromyces lactis]|uniref:Mannan endo-1,6-alpha-mannosidase n=1 Tax=Kluyveromyces lactis (strain ATCC 8585 / CBS 2359 / DSM 70799 / NBRC 1267 / NRRL Y-1140 / WM37) TaxID=284590 RepID=Q6CP42_KLULA|nr:uncharacterized protein KLLA0_E07723g [Kluyveromyces lactis]CAG99384.1 KLLA0E07723p [Kluyveromyces lactis]|eukprot:XP_454297.1 uncharacterized protein KLLA0_E07723g [Kluyveromyces lactis]